MKKVFLILIFALNYGVANAQLEMRLNPYIKGEIVLKNDSIKIGFIKLDDSAFRVRFKKNSDQKGREKIDFKSIKKIILSSKSSQERMFFYKKTNSNKFLKFVELIHQSKCDVYLSSHNDLSLFYKDVDRSNVNDFLAFTALNLSLKHTKEDEDGKTTHYYNNPTNDQIRQYVAQVENPKYLIHNKNTDRLQYIYSNRTLRNDAKNLFKGCSNLIEKIESKKLDIDSLFKIINLYNSCDEIE